MYVFEWVPLEVEHGKEVLDHSFDDELPFLVHSFSIAIVFNSPLEVI